MCSRMTMTLQRVSVLPLSKSKLFLHSLRKGLRCQVFLDVFRAAQQKELSMEVRCERCREAGQFRVHEIFDYNSLPSSLAP